MRTPVCRATASSAAFRGTRSSARLTVRSSGESGSASCKATGRTLAWAAYSRTGVPATTSRPATVIRNRIPSLPPLLPRMNGSEPDDAVGPRESHAQHFRQGCHRLIRRFRRERDRQPLLLQRRISDLDVEVVPAFQLREDARERRIVEPERPARPGEVVLQRTPLAIVPPPLES